MRAPEHAVKIKQRAVKSRGNPAEGMTAQWFKSQKTRAVKTLQIVTSTLKNRYENHDQQRVYAFSPRAGKYSKNRPSVHGAGSVPSWIGGRASKAGPYVDPSVQAPVAEVVDTVRQADCSGRPCAGLEGPRRVPPAARDPAPSARSPRTCLEGPRRGGVKSGIAYGQTDELGYEAVENPMHVHDLHATVLHLLGLDHERLTYRYAGRDMRLTDVKGVVHSGILA
jgi:hypothetical protein